MSYKATFEYDGKHFIITRIFKRDRPLSNIVYATDSNHNDWSFSEKEGVFTPLQQYPKKTLHRYKK